MSIAFYLLNFLVATTPALAIAGGDFAEPAIALLGAAMLAIAAIGHSPVLSSTAQLLKRFVPALLFPLLWMTCQIVPVPQTLAHPVWSATAIALNDASLRAHISLDPGATLRSLAWYLTLVTVLISAIIVTTDRHQAKTVHFVLTAVTTFISITVLISQFHAFAGLIPTEHAAAAPFAALPVVAILLNGAIIVRAIERYLNRNEIDAPARRALLLEGCSGLGGLALSVAAIVILGRNDLLAVAAAGLTMFPLVALARHLGILPSISAGAFGAIIAMLVGAILVRLHAPSHPGLLGFAVSNAHDSITLTQRALADSPSLGSGIGTFELLSRAYQDFGAAPEPTAASTATSIVIEWGTPALIVLLGFAAQLFFFMLRGAIRRGRDWFFSATAAAALPTLLCEAFLDPSLSSYLVQTVVVVLISLGLSQTFGRTSGLADSTME
ncbi:hypothetical protein JQ615_17420 [Bradyrhizobium jicamae]|uniref:O-antigen ligase domain-containing protein n=1 Tax=Bradyrhizobium jicamae TaxID=280332 RepID=A0ABS5FK64_9BRAD|nr:hypothetical protein [Bradyrhizobium jicamae]MBR0797175.1 hypothetical protein [Bradyrhizobium jicamae]